MSATLIDPLQAQSVVSSDTWRRAVRVDESSGCHVWVAAKTRGGYGHLRLSDGKYYRAHRIALVAALRRADMARKGRGRKSQAHYG